MAVDDDNGAGATLDPEDWDATRAQAHVMLDDMLDYIAKIRERPVWQPIPDDVRAKFRAGLPHGPQTLEAVHDAFMHTILPYTSGNVHPGFVGWVHGGGTVNGMLAEMLAAGLNANLGGRDHIPVAVEWQIVEWVREMFGFPAGASGLFVTGTSMANLMAVLVARTARLGRGVRQSGLRAMPALRAYSSAAAHGCIPRAFDLSGLGSDALRLLPVDASFRIDIPALKAAIAEDRAAGLEPFMIVGTAGTVDTGAVDDLAMLAAIAGQEKMWFHIDGAYGALGVLSPEIAPTLNGLSLADSVAFDFHKWAQVPYDAGFLIVRDGVQHRDTFASPAAYLRRETRGLAAGEIWPHDLGPDLSRGFRALKTWFTFKTYGADRIGDVIARTCRMARHLEQRIRAEPELELMAPAQLNIVCFRYRAPDPGPLNAEILADLQESGIAAPSSTFVKGEFAIRAALVNHRIQPGDVDAMVDAVLRFGRQRIAAG